MQRGLVMGKAGQVRGAGIASVLGGFPASGYGKAFRQSGKAFCPEAIPPKCGMDGTGIVN